MTHYLVTLHFSKSHNDPFKCNLDVKLLGDSCRIWVSWALKFSNSMRVAEPPHFEAAPVPAKLFLIAVMLFQSLFENSGPVLSTEMSSAVASKESTTQPSQQI
jgi:hypothetical protein